MKFIKHQDGSGSIRLNSIEAEYIYNAVREGKNQMRSYGASFGHAYNVTFNDDEAIKVCHDLMRSLQNIPDCYGAANSLGGYVVFDLPSRAPNGKVEL